MLNPISITENLLYSTLAVRTDIGDGTGFIFVKSEADFTLPLLITNKHVVHGCKQLKLTFHLQTDGMPNGKQFTITHTDPHWIDHPGADIDLCAIPLAPYSAVLVEKGVAPFIRSIDESIFPTQEQLDALTTLEDVVMVGYPNGLSDEINNFPLFRRGSTASHPAVDFNGKPEAMVDMACFPGSSGSPILLLNENGYRSKTGDYYMGSSRVFLLGVLARGPVWRRDGVIEVRDIPTQQLPVPVTNLMIHLGYYIKTREVEVLVQHVAELAAAQASPQTPE